MQRLALLLAFAAAAAAQSRPVELKDYYALETVSAPVLSPDGTRLGFVRTRIIEAENKRLSEVWLGPADGSAAPVCISDAKVSSTMPRWTPDGKTLIYTANSRWFGYRDGQSNGDSVGRLRAGSQSGRAVDRVHEENTARESRSGAGFGVRQADAGAVQRPHV